MIFHSLPLPHRFQHPSPPLSHQPSPPQFGRTQPTLGDVTLALNDAGISVSELQDYLKEIDSTSLPQPVADFPVAAVNEMGFPDPLELELGKRFRYDSLALPVLSMRL